MVAIQDIGVVVEDILVIADIALAMLLLKGILILTLLKQLKLWQPIVLLVKTSFAMHAIG